MTTFAPGPAAERDLRRALGAFGTGVAIVTAMTPQGPCGITANSFASVSLDPPLVLWSAGRSSDRFAIFDAARFTGIHILARAQLPLARRFARNGWDFDGIGWSLNGEGVPLLDECLARFECELQAGHDGGDHRILVSRVRRITLAEGEPLIFALGRFGSFTGAS